MLELSSKSIPTGRGDKEEGNFTLLTVTHCDPFCFLLMGVLVFYSSSVITDGQIPSPGRLSHVLCEHTCTHMQPLQRSPCGKPWSPVIMSWFLSVLCRTNEIVLALDVKQVMAMNN